MWACAGTARRIAARLRPHTQRLRSCHRSDPTSVSRLLARRDSCDGLDSPVRGQSCGGVVIGSVLHVRAGGPGGGGGARAAALTAARPDEINGVGERLLFLRLKYRNAMVDGTIASRSKTLNPARREPSPSRYAEPRPRGEVEPRLEARSATARSARRGQPAPAPSHRCDGSAVRHNVAATKFSSSAKLLFLCPEVRTHALATIRYTHSLRSTPTIFACKQQHKRY